MIPKIELASNFGVVVHTSNDRGFTPEELSKRCSDKVVAVSDSAPPAIRAQAHAFKGRVEKIVEFYLHEAIKNDRTTVCNALKDAGHPELAELIRRL